MDYVDKLSPREVEVVELLAQGLSNRIIARRLGISAHTTKFHIANIVDKLDAKTRTDAAVMYVATKAFQRGFELARQASPCPQCSAKVLAAA